MTLRFFQNERSALAHYLPSLDEQLAQLPFMALETAGSQGVAMYKAAGGAGLLIPTMHNGGGASALDAVRLTRALAARSPSLAIATTMHQFSVASLVALAHSSTGQEWMLLDAVATDKRLMSSGFAEGRTAQGILAPTMRAEWDGHNWLVSGRKQPCSLSRSMDLLTASVQLIHPEQPERVAIAIIGAESPGLRVEPFWRSNVLAGAESDAVVLDKVVVHPSLIFEITSRVNGGLDDLQTLGFIWFELLVAACYLGVAGALVEDVLIQQRGSTHERAQLAMSYEAAAMALDGAARMLDGGDVDNDALARSLIVRFAQADSVRNIVAHAVELLGGMAFIRSERVAYLSAAAHAIGFHPPSRLSTLDAMLAWFEGQAMILE